MTSAIHHGRTHSNTGAVAHNKSTSASKLKTSSVRLSKGMSLSSVISQPLSRPPQPLGTNKPLTSSQSPSSSPAQQPSQPQQQYSTPPAPAAPAAPRAPPPPAAPPAPAAPAAPAAPPPPPPPPAAPAAPPPPPQGLPPPQAGRGDLLAAIRGAGGIQSLKKTKKKK